eukprot:c2000_g1_i2.p1 GENE.c2000_g1_i2~~c2000_g1_i2.p1  ORF type:complete len:137 (+),score=30.00 c2000_g1_i2:90-500(+)
MNNMLRVSVCFVLAACVVAVPLTTLFETASTVNVLPTISLRANATKPDAEYTGGKSLIWAFADHDGNCMDTRTNYPGLWVTRKGSCIDTGMANCPNITFGSSCKEMGYTIVWDFKKDLPSVVQALYVGISGWQKPQ